MLFNFVSFANTSLIVQLLWCFWPLPGVVYVCVCVDRAALPMDHDWAEMSGTANLCCICISGQLQGQQGQKQLHIG